MRDIITTGLANMALRGVGMLSKFALVLFLGKNFGLEELGLYGLLATTIVMVVQLVGFDFYLFNTREILSTDLHSRPKFVRDQFLVHLLFYCVFFPFVLVVFFADILPWSIIVPFYFLLILEHLSQELSRLYTTLSQPVFANFLFMLRTAGWIIVFVLACYLSPDVCTFEELLIFWLIGSVVSVTVGCVPMTKWDWGKQWLAAPDWQWIKGGIVASLPIYIGTIGLQTIDLADRFILKIYQSTEIVGVYVFYQNLANIIQTAIVTGLIMIVAPRMTQAYLNNRKHDYQQYYRQITLGILIGGSVLILLLLAIMPVVLDYMGKVEFKDNILVFYVLMGSVFTMLLAMLPYYSLFVRKRDKTLMSVMLAAALINLVLNLVLIPRYGMLGASIATLVAFGVVLLSRFISLGYFVRQEKKVVYNET